MTVSMISNKVSYIGNGISKVFAIPFSFLETRHLNVYQLVENVQTQRTDWTISGGNLVFNTAPENKSQIVILREVPYTQETDYRENEILAAETLERNLDKLTMLSQQLKEELERCVKVDVFSDVDPVDLGKHAERVWESADNIDAVAGQLAAVRTTAENIRDVGSVAGKIGAVDTVAGNMGYIVALYRIQAAISAVADIVSAVSSVAGVTQEISFIVNHIKNEGGLFYAEYVPAADRVIIQGQQDHAGFLFEEV